jgi:hypothetical protein
MQTSTRLVRTISRTRQTPIACGRLVIAYRDDGAVEHVGADGERRATTTADLSRAISITATRQTMRMIALVTRLV